jgi:endonuclease/exonuclease/phosphatase family metal-dependent hydrolase
MRILTLNTWHNNGPSSQRREALVERSIQYAPDILLFQELFDTDWSKELQARLAYPFLVSTESARSGLVIISKLPPKSCEIYQMKTKSPFENYWRYALAAELSDGARELNVFNTHLSWELQDYRTREAQVRELWSLMQTRVQRPENGFFIVTGDFNSTPDSPAMAWFLAQSRLIDTYGTLHPRATGFTWSNSNPFAQHHRPVLPDRRIDYIFASPSLAENRLKHCEVVFDRAGALGIFASDHFGLLADFDD